MTRKDSLEKSIADLSEALDLDYIGGTGFTGNPSEMLSAMKKELEGIVTDPPYSSLSDLITDNDLASERGYDGDL